MSGTCRRFALVGAFVWFGVFSQPARADEPFVDRSVVPASLSAGINEPVPPRKSGRVGSAQSGGNIAGWWLGPVGIAGALAVVGGISLAAKRFNLNLGFHSVRDLGVIGVVGQTRLSPKHAVYLVRVADRVLIVGAGSGGSPSPLGEITDPGELDRLIPRRAGRIAPSARSVIAPRVGQSRSTGFDQRIGDDE